MLRLSRFTTFDSLIIDHLSGVESGVGSGSDEEASMVVVQLEGGSSFVEVERSSPLRRSSTFLPLEPSAILALDMRSADPRAYKSALSFSPIGPSSSELPFKALAVEGKEAPEVDTGVGLGAASGNADVPKGSAGAGAGAAKAEVPKGSTSGPCAGAAKPEVPKGSTAVLGSGAAKAEVPKGSTTGGDAEDDRAEVPKGSTAVAGAGAAKAETPKGSAFEAAGAGETEPPAEEPKRLLRGRKRIRRVKLEE